MSVLVVAPPSVSSTTVLPVEMDERSFSSSRVWSDSDCASRACPYTTAGTRPAARSLRATPLPVSVRASALNDADSTAANHDPGATLRRLRPPYHAVRLGETDRGDFQLLLTVYRLTVFQ